MLYAFYVPKALFIWRCRAFDVNLLPYLRPNVRMLAAKKLYWIDNKSIGFLIELLDLSQWEVGKAEMDLSTSFFPKVLL